MIAEILQKQAMIFMEFFKMVLESLGSKVESNPQENAMQSIEPGGEFSAENTSQRIFDFAVNLSGGDDQKLSDLKDAITEGFKAAEKMMGGNLPKISYETYDMTMQKFDEYFAN